MTRRVLLIEDNEHNRYLVTFLLEQHGYEVTAAENGPSGIEIAVRARPDLVLLDIQLPGMDGYEVVRALKRMPAMAGVPVVALTSYAMAGDREQALAAGCDGYFEKPLDPEVFSAQLEPFFERPGAC